VDGGCPVIKANEPCPRHSLAAHIVVTTRGSETSVASVDTGAGGRFEITLRPGSYDVHATSAAGGPLPVAPVYSVTVRAHAFATLRIQFDSGIR